MNHDDTKSSFIQYFVLWLQDQFLHMGIGGIASTYSIKSMHQHKFNFYLNIVIDRKNSYREMQDTSPTDHNDLLAHISQWL